MYLSTLNLDTKKVLWGKTLKLNLLRAFAGGVGLVLLIGTIALFDPQTAQALGPNGIWDMIFAFPIIAPLTYLVFVPLVLIAAWLATIFPGGALVSGICNIFPLFIVVLGDPFLFILSKFKPALLPVEPKFINFKVILFILDESAE